MRTTAFCLFLTAPTLLVLGCSATVTMQDDGEDGSRNDGVADGSGGGKTELAGGGGGPSGSTTGPTGGSTTCQASVPRGTGGRDPGTVGRIAQLSPPGLSLGGVSGITFDDVMDPLVIDGWGQHMWRVSASTGAITASYALAVPEAATRTLAFDGERLVTTRRTGAMDALATVSPDDGTVTEIGAVGQFNFVGLAVHPVTCELWMVNDCADPPSCSWADGARLWRVDPSTGAATPGVALSPNVGAGSAVAIDDEGTFYVAVGGNHPQIWTMDPTTGAGSLVHDPQLGISIITDLEFQPGTRRLFGVEEDRGADPRAWHLVSFGQL